MFSTLNNEINYLPKNKSSLQAINQKLTIDISSQKDSLITSVDKNIETISDIFIINFNNEMYTYYILLKNKEVSAKSINLDEIIDISKKFNVFKTADNQI